MSPLVFVLSIVVVGSLLLVLAEGLQRRKPSTEMTERDVKLYRQAAKLINELVNVSDLNDLSTDVLSVETHTRLSAWLTDYKKVLKK